MDHVKRIIKHNAFHGSGANIQPDSHREASDSPNHSQFTDEGTATIPSIYTLLTKMSINVAAHQGQSQTLQCLRPPPQAELRCPWHDSAQ
ncbi:hypothetical protein SDC9_208098 [bioreactor metagenome]|uniref:Uncharacterized protein n=1 Tax=bioreactor metagenome TaxID=1076179 RepID=A0A645JB45_9ZZZZ